MKRLTKQQIINLQKLLIDRYSGTHGICDEGLLASALNAPFQTFSGNELYPDITEKAARLGFGLIQGHAFVDGNKRNRNSCHAYIFTAQQSEHKIFGQ